MIFAANAETLMSVNTANLSLSSFGLVIFVHGLFSVTAAGLAIWVVKETSERQDARHRGLDRVNREQLPPPPPRFEEAPA